METKFYKELSIHEKINYKSWSFWRLSNDDGYFLTMIDNAESFEREDYANFTKHVLTNYCFYAMPRRNINQGIYNKLFHERI